MIKILACLLFLTAQVAAAENDKWLGVYTTDEISDECERVGAYAPFHIAKGGNLNGVNFPDWLDQQYGVLIKDAKTKGFNALVGFQENIVFSGDSNNGYVSYRGVAIKVVCK